MFYARPCCEQRGPPKKVGFSWGSVVLMGHSAYAAPALGATAVAVGQLQPLEDSLLVAHGCWVAYCEQCRQRVYVLFRLEDDSGW